MPTASFTTRSSKRVFVMDGDPDNSAVIDAKSGGVVGTIELGGGPEFAVADGKGSVYINLEDKNEIVAVDSVSLKIKSRWPVAPAGAPTALAMDVSTAGCSVPAVIPRCWSCSIPTAEKSSGPSRFPAGWMQLPTSGDWSDLRIDARWSRARVPRRLARQIQRSRNPQDRNRRQNHGPRHQNSQPISGHGRLRASPYPYSRTSASRGAAIPGTFRVLVYGQ